MLRPIKFAVCLSGIPLAPRADMARLVKKQQFLCPARVPGGAKFRRCGIFFDRITRREPWSPLFDCL